MVDMDNHDHRNEPASRREIEALRAELREELLAELRAEFRSHSSQQHPADGEISQPSDEDVPRSRRWLLAAGAGATAAGVAAVVGEASPAAALHQPEDLGLGITNTSTARTTLTSSSINGAFWVENSLNGPGLTVRSGSATAFNAASTSGVGVQILGTGRLHQAVQSVQKPTFVAFKGEQVRTNDGQLWISVDGAGLWQKVAAVAPGAKGGSMNMLAAPVRLYDSRPGNPDASSVAQTKLQPGSPRTLPVAGVFAANVPLGAVGIAGTITVTNTTGNAYAYVYPTGASTPATSNVNWTPGQTVAASFIAALSSNGELNVGTAATTDVIIDIAGYIY
jgi:hypothetical protein